MNNMRKMKLCLVKQGYSEIIADQELGKVKFSKSSRRTSKRDKGVSLIVMYCPLI